MNYHHNPIKSWIQLIWKNQDKMLGMLMARKNLILYVIGIFLIFFFINNSFKLSKSNVFLIANNCNKENQPYDFTNFNNETGTPDGCYIVPNFVHFVRFGSTPISYLHMICYLAAFKHQKPDKIYFHYNDMSTFSGKYWDILKSMPRFMEIVEFNFVELPYEIFGQKLSESWRPFHASDITRIRMLIKYGGIFLDNDSYLVRSLNDFRRYEMTIGWDGGGQFLGTQILVAHKDARFLNEWLETYRGHYKQDGWYYNAGERPTVEVLYKRPELVHRVKYLFGVHNSLIRNIFKDYWPQWRYMYALHLLHRHMYILGDYAKELPKEFDEINVKNYDNSFREMALDVYNPDNSKFQFRDVFRR